MITIPISHKDSIITCAVEFKGHKGNQILHMGIDTGATYTIIPVETAILIGCNPVIPTRRIEIIMGGSTEYLPVVRVPDVRIFGAELKKIEVICHNLPPKSPVHGLLGLNILRYFDIWFKFKSNILEIS